MELLLRARHADVEEPPLLLQVLALALRVPVRQESVLEAGQEDDRKLESLGAVQRHQADAALAVPGVEVGDQRDMVEEGGEEVLVFAAAVALRLGEVLRRREELADVLELGLVLLVVSPVHVGVAGLRQQLVEERRQAAAPRRPCAACG